MFYVILRRQARDLKTYKRRIKKEKKEGETKALELLSRLFAKLEVKLIHGIKHFCTCT